MLYKWGIFFVYTCIISSAAFGNHDISLNMFLTSIGLKSIRIISFSPSAISGISHLTAMEWETLAFEPNATGFFGYLGAGAILIQLIHSSN